MRMVGVHGTQAGTPHVVGKWWPCMCLHTMRTSARLCWMSGALLACLTMCSVTSPLSSNSLSVSRSHNLKTLTKGCCQPAHTGSISSCKLPPKSPRWSSQQHAAQLLIGSESHTPGASGIVQPACLTLESKAPRSSSTGGHKTFTLSTLVRTMESAFSYARSYYAICVPRVQTLHKS